MELPFRPSTTAVCGSTSNRISWAPKIPGKLDSIRRYPNPQGDLALVRNLAMRDTSNNYIRFLFGPLLSPYAILRVLHLARNAAAFIWGAEPSLGTYDNNIREAFVRFWRDDVVEGGCAILGSSEWTLAGHHYVTDVPFTKPRQARSR